MSKLNYLIALNLALALGAANVGAELRGPGGPKQESDPNDLLMRCTNQGQYQQIIPPRFVTLRCHDTQYSWMKEKPGTMPLSTSRTVQTSLETDKQFVPTSGGVNSAGVVPTACDRYQQVKYMLTLERTLSCAEYVGLATGKQSLDDYCAGQLTNAKGQAKPGKGGKQVGTTEPVPGAVIDTCDFAQ